MFASVRHLQPRPTLDPKLLAQVRPIAAASSRVLPVVPALQSLFGPRGLQRGSTVRITAQRGSGGSTLALTVLSAPSAAGHWCGVVGMADPGVAAMVGLGVDLRRVVFVPAPGAAWPSAVGELIDGADIVLVRCERPVTHPVARNLVAKARDRQVTLVIVTSTPEQWPLPSDVELSISDARWSGADGGYGHFVHRRAVVSASGRRGAVREHVAALWLPSSDGDVAVAE
jgi:hypothetical protein